MEGPSPSPARPNSAGTGAAASRSALSSPTSIRAGAAGRKRDRSLAGLESSPGSVDDGVDDDDAGDERRRTPGVKRACNECRQQKLRCDVVQEPFSTCSRCRRLNLDCKIESSFKRVGKRSKNAEMEREIVELKKQLAAMQRQRPLQPPPFTQTPQDSDSSELYNVQHTQEHFMGSDEAVASLLDLRQGIEGGAGYIKASQGTGSGVRKLGDVSLSASRITELFNQFFTFYHPLLPILDPDKTPDHYYNKCPLLFWTVVSIAARRFTSEPALLTSLTPPFSKLVWSTLSEVPQSYLVVKALCLLCTWPLPISSTSADPTFMFSGIMTHVAMQIGLHRPSHAQDFTKFHVQLREEELRDRVKTWAACNIVAQSVSTGYGQPPSTVYDWTLKPSPDKEASYRLPEELETRLRIEKFSDKVTQGLYSSANDPVGLTDDVGRSSISSLLAREYEDLEARVGSNGSSINVLHLRAAGLHLRLSAFFDSNTAKDYQRDLLSLYFATTSFLEYALSLETSDGGVFSFASNYILQMTIAGGFTLLKLLNSFFASHIDLDHGKALFHKTIWAIRKISVMTNDLPSRLAEVLAQLWRGGGEGARLTEGGGAEVETDGSLQLKVKCRMSMSLVYDSVWRWREEFQAKGRGNLDSAVKNPTNPDSAAEESSRSSSVGQPLVQVGISGLPSAAGAVTPGPSNSYGEANYEVFDPLNWMLDGFVDFPYSLTAVQGLETPGMA